MFAWNNRPIDHAGVVFFRGSLPPRLANFPQFDHPDISVVPAEANAHLHWSARLTHKAWGAGALLTCHRGFDPIPDVIHTHDPRLNDQDHDAIRAAGSMVGVRLELPGEAARANVLRDRKVLLRFLALVLGDDGLIALDPAAQKFWPRETLADELVHEADLDIDSLFILHIIPSETEKTPDGEAVPVWLHSHGLSGLGALDFDILRPSPMLLSNGFDAVRALAYQLLERGEKAADQTVAPFAPGGQALLVPVERFNRAAPAADRALRNMPLDDVEHHTRRVIVCDPAKRRLFGLLPPAAPRPSQAFSTLDGDRMLAMFPTAATRLMAQRARQTFPLFRALAAEFADMQVKPIAKIGYLVDGQTESPDADREHLWFEVHDFTEEGMDATLLNAPFRVSRLKEGARAHQPASMLTDWTIFTPGGQLTPRAMGAARSLRVNRDKILAMLAAMPGKS